MKLGRPCGATVLLRVRHRHRVVLAVSAVTVGVVLIVAACGGDGSSAPASPEPAPAEPAPAEPAPAEPQAPDIVVADEYLAWFAADGTRLAFPLYAGEDECITAEVWDVATGRRVELPVPPRPICWYEFSGVGVWEMAVAGGRVAWLAEGYSNTISELRLYTAKVGPAPAAKVVATGNALRESYGGGHLIGHLSGDAQTIAFLTWKEAFPRGKISKERVWRLGPEGRKRPLGRLAGVHALDVHRDTVAVLQGNGSLTLIDSGTRRAIMLEGIKPQLRDRWGTGLALTDSQAVVFTQDTIAIFDRATGSAVATWPLPPGEVGDPDAFDVEGDYATFLVSDKIHVMRLSDGATAAIPTARVAPAECEQEVWAQMEPQGLLYASADRGDPEQERVCQRSQLGTIDFGELEQYVSDAQAGSSQTSASQEAK